MTVSTNFYHHIISYNMDLYRRCLEHCEALLQKELEEWEKDWLEATDQVEDEHVQAELSLFIGSEQEERQQFKSILINSFFAASFGMFEHELVGFCHRAQGKTHNPFSVDDLGSRSPTERVKRYLTKLGIEFPANSQMWKEITKYRELRNRIMHEGGRLRDSEELTEYARSHDLLATIGRRPDLALTRTFYEEAVGNMITFLLSVFDAYEAWLRSSREKPEGAG